MRLRQMEREAEANRLIYETFLNRLKETSEQSGLQQADARLISPAEAAELASTSTAAMLARFLALGIALGLGIVYLTERFNNTFRTAAEVEEGTGAQVLSTLPRSGRRTRREQVLDYVRDKPISALAEGVRNLRTALLLSSIDEPPKVVMVTSSLPGEGKSTTSLLLAYMSTQMGRKAIVVDCDIRRPTLARSFKLEGGGDLISVLDRSSELDAAIQFDKLSGLHLLPTRNSVPQAADVLSSNRFSQLIRDLAERFDLVVLDAPPVLLVSDAGAIGKCADATIYAIQWDQTPREAAKKGLKQLRDFGIRVNGTVLTLVNRRAEAQYSSYQYGYGMYRNKYYVD